MILFQLNSLKELSKSELYITQLDYDKLEVQLTKAHNEIKELKAIIHKYEDERQDLVNTIGMTTLNLGSYKDLKFPEV